MDTESGSWRRLERGELSWSCPAEWIGYASTGEAEEAGEIAGQEPAVAALRLAIRLRAPGYNVFVAGVPGTGRTATARRILREEAGGGPVPDDICYVFGFDDPRSPTCLRLPPGRGRLLEEAMTAVARQFPRGVSALRASQAHRRRRDAVARPFRQRQNEVLDAFDEEVSAQGFTLVEVKLGNFKRHEIAPLIGGQPVPLDELDDLVEQGTLDAGRAALLKERHPALTARLSEVTARVRTINRELEQALAETDRRAATPLVEEILEEVRSRVRLRPGEHAAFDRHLAAVRRFLLAVSPSQFSAADRATGDFEEASSGALLETLRVNVLVDRTDQQGRPVVEETHPTPERLLGTLEVLRDPERGLVATHARLRPGALHRADGGFLLINAVELINEDGAFAALRRSLRAGQVAFEIGRLQDGPPPLQPEPMPLDVTVVLVGPPVLREQLAENDPDFLKMFKVVALFDDRIDVTQDAVRGQASFLAKVVREEELLPFGSAAAARVLEQMVRLAGGNGKLSTRFRMLADLCREASWTAREQGAERVEPHHVDEAIAARRRRSSLLSSRVFESIARRVLRLEFEGRRVGQINGLAVIESAFERFGYPVRLTATAAVGRSGIIDIEREAELAGEIHTKASLILAGFLRSRFAQKRPLSVTASICFEQSYGGVEGDSASAAELVALLSALSGVPIRQDLAVTGAVDQLGQMLAVGGVNEKVEGFWRACRDRGLTGTQGVVIPESSVPALQLAPEVIADVEAGRFSLHAVSHVAGLVELMTGVPFGEPDGKGRWPEESIGGKVAVRLEQMAEALRRYGGGRD
ncbi:MAG: ATP-binding protein [Acidobacteriota bacterium]